VLLLVSVTLALCYAAVRSQFNTLQIHRNAARRVSARAVAVTGLTMAIKKMHTAEWQGVDTTLTGSLNAYENFAVTYTAGDPSLAAGDADYDDLPYRVTLLATGYAADPDNPTGIATHQVRAVVRLLPRAVAKEPTDWPTMQQYTLYQSRRDLFEIDLPCRIEGPTRIQGTLELARHYPNDNAAWRRYLEDLNSMRLTGWPDYRPFDGPVHFPLPEQDLAGSALTNLLVVPTVDVRVDETAADWVEPVAPTTYQIYDGGPVYDAPRLADPLEDVTLEPDPATNPLGIFYRDGNLRLRGNVSIRGTLFCKDDINIESPDVQFASVDMPGLHGTDGPLRLPVATCNDFVVKSAAGANLTGFLAVFDEFRIDKGPETMEVAVTGRVVTRKFFIKEREPWNTLNWGDLYDEFNAQLDGSQGPVVPYFPVWMGLRGRDPKPRLTISPDSGPITYHWHYPGNRIYVPHPDDDGLRWDLIEWTENP